MYIYSYMYALALSLRSAGNTSTLKSHSQIAVYIAPFPRKNHDFLKKWLITVPGQGQQSETI